MLARGTAEGSEGGRGGSAFVGVEMGRERQRGFSFAEVIVALALLGMVLGIGAYTMNTGAVRSGAAQVELARQLDFARARAVFAGHDMVVTFDTTAGTYTVIEDKNSDGDLDAAYGEVARTFRLADLGKAVQYGFASSTTGLGGSPIAAAVSAPGSPPRLRFTSRGTCEDATIYLIPIVDKARDTPAHMRAVTVNGGSARIRRWRFDPARSPVPWRPEI